MSYRPRSTRSAPSHLHHQTSLVCLVTVLFLTGCSGPAFEGVESAGTGKDGAVSLSIPVPASTTGDAAGDLLVSILGVKANPNTSTSDGWTAVPGFGGFNGAVCVADAQGPACQLSIFYKIADGSETNVSFDWGPSRHAAAIVLRYSNVDATGPIGAARSQRGSSDAPTAPVVNTTQNGTRVLRIVVTETDDAMNFLDGSEVLFDAPNTARANLISFPDATTNAATGCGPPLSGCRETEDAIGLAVSDSRRGSAGGSGTASWELPGGDQWLAASVEIVPAAP